MPVLRAVEGLVAGVDRDCDVLGPQARELLIFLRKAIWWNSCSNALWKRSQMPLDWGLRALVPEWSMSSTAR